MECLHAELLAAFLWKPRAGWTKVQQMSGEFGANRKRDWKTSRKQHPVTQRNKRVGSRKQTPHHSLTPHPTLAQVPRNSPP